jgi:hypothetical protein
MNEQITRDNIIRDSELINKAVTENLEREAERIAKADALQQKTQAQAEEGYDGFSDTTVKLIPSPNFSGAKSVGTMLPINLANETVTNLTLLARKFDFIDFIKEKLNYSSRVKVVQSFSSEQIDALVLSIKSFESGNGFILGDMAGIGKGRICAGIMRYAHTQGIIPVFFTQKPYLLNDIYRDLINIDGIGMDKKERSVPPRPFVMHNEGVIVDIEGNPIPTSQAYKTSYTNGEAIYRFIDNKNPNSINEFCIQMTEEIDRTQNIKLFKDFNAVMLPYSVVSQGKSMIRRNFLNAIASNSILIFDESHNAASANLNSKILQVGIPLVKASKGVLFSSATWAKNPSVFNLYVVKTSLRTAVPTLDSITDALKVGGENVSEYISSGLAKEGQMIRRERSFGDCLKVTEYVGSIRKEDDFGQTIYSDLPDDTQRAFYDEAIGYFKELRDFSKSDNAASAISIAVMREASKLNLKLEIGSLYNELLKDVNKAPNIDAMRTSFIKQNAGKYIAEFSPDSITRYKATFRENLFLAIKGKFAADKVIESLSTPVEYKDVDGTVRKTPQKPIIAMKNTGERIFDELQLEIGQEVNNDFSEYLKAIYNKMFVGEVKFRKIDSNIFESVKTLASSGTNYTLIIADYKVELDDFSDGGQEITEIQSKLDNYKSALPFSVIDYLRDRIESVQRPSVYFGYNGAPLYGQASSPYYRFAEATSRNSMLKRDEDGILRFQKNDRMKSTTKIFRAFNSGSVDVMLINVVASTGGSAQSSPSEGADTRQRNMFIVQFELDVNIEVQKRGRVNRTGQLNSPVYTYIITKIPAEKRQYLMLRRKLRKLDANTSADQTASKRSAEMTDNKGNVIEDIFNHYGYEVFVKDFIEAPENVAYHSIFEAMGFRKKSGVQGQAEQNEINTNEFDAFVRELELYPADFQEEFFDEMNQKYIQNKIALIAEDNYQEELETQRYKASLKERVVIQLNSGSTVFSLPLFYAYYYTLESKRPLSKDKRDQKANELAVWDKQPMKPVEFYDKFINDYLSESKKATQAFEKELDDAAPLRKEFPKNKEGQEKYNKAYQNFLTHRKERLDRQNDVNTNMYSLLLFFKPYTKVTYKGNIGMFIGYKIKKSDTKFKYSAGNIEFVFCFLSRYPILSLKTTTGLQDLIDIRLSTRTFFQTDFQVNEKKVAIEKIDNWKPDLNKRIIRAFLIGNILSGIVEADKRKKEDKISSWALNRFYNMDGSVTTGIELKFDSELPDTAKIRVSGEQLTVSSDNFNMYEYIKGMPDSTGVDFRQSLSSQSAQTIFPIWNTESEKLVDRAICIVSRPFTYKKPDTGETIDTNVVDFEIIQKYKVEEIKLTRQKLIKDVKKGEKAYNELFYDQEFEQMFSKYLMSKIPERTKIKYAFKRNPTPKNPDGGLYYDYNCYIKRYKFVITDEAEIKTFLSELHKRYDANFNFRSNIADYYNIEEQGDDAFTRSLESGKKEQIRAFPEGDYQYRFMKNIPESTYTSIPYVIERTTDSTYGGVILSQPLLPNLLPSFDMKPYRFPNDIYIKLALSVLDEEAKAKFVKTIEEMAEVKNDDAYTIGEYVLKFLTERSVDITYFFGDLRISEFGSIFREFALKQDLEKIIIEDRKEEDVIEAIPSKKQVTLEDAENYIIKLLQQI